VTTGSGHTVVSGATGSTVTVEADNLVQDSTISGALASAELVVDGSGTVTVNDLLADLNAAGFSGSQLTVNTQALTGDGTDPAIEIVTGTTNMTINGDDSNNTDKDVLDIRVDASALAGQSVSDVNQALTLAGDAEYLIRNTSTGNTLYLDIYSIADDNTVALEGTGGFDLTGTSADVDASALSGAVTVHTKNTATDAEDDILVTAGTGITTVDAVESVDKITLDAGLLLDDEADTYNQSSTDATEVKVTGLGDVTVNALKADLDASTFSGTLTVNRGQITGDAIDDVDIQVGVNGAVINAGQALNLTYIDASAMGTDGTVTLLGDGAPIFVDQVATGAAIDATGGTYGTALTGTLAVTTASGATGVEVKTGTAATTVSADAGSVSVDATDLTAALTLSGSSAYTVTELETNLIASSTSGTLTVSTDAITGSGTTPKLTITAGTGNMTVNGDDSVEGNTTDLDITINASSLSDSSSDTDLVLTGDAEYLITSTAGTGVVTIDASALESDGRITLSGTGDFRLVNTTSDVLAPKFYIAIFSAKPAALIPGLSIQRTIGGEDATRAAIILQTLTENIGLKGGTSGGKYWCSLLQPKVPAIFTGAPISNYTFPVYEWPDAIINKTPSDIKFIYNVGSNLLNQGSDINKNITAFNNVDFVVTHDSFLTPTARFSDIILPTTIPQVLYKK